MIRVTLKDLEDVHISFGEYLSERNKYSKPEILAKIDKVRFNKFRNRLESILALALDIQKNLRDIFSLINKLDLIKDKKAIERYNTMIKNLPNLIKNIKIHLTRFY